jgi:competence protein ComEA
MALITVGVGYNLKSKLTPPEVVVEKATTIPSVIQVVSKVVFDISGEVLKPGVYSLSKGSRINEALAAAGGLAANADREWVELNINKAKVISDGEKIFIPRVPIKGTRTLEPNVGAGLVPAQMLGIQTININTAEISELDKLDGVGPAIAQRIIDYRQKNGGFKDINEIKMVTGIGDKMFEKIKDLIGI